MGEQRQRTKSPTKVADNGAEDLRTDIRAQLTTARWLVGGHASCLISPAAARWRQSHHPSTGRNHTRRLHVLIMPLAVDSRCRTTHPAAMTTCPTAAFRACFLCANSSRRQSPNCRRLVVGRRPSVFKERNCIQFGIHSTEVAIVSQQLLSHSGLSLSS